MWVLARASLHQAQVLGRTSGEGHGVGEHPPGGASRRSSPGVQRPVVSPAPTFFRRLDAAAASALS